MRYMRYKELQEAREQLLRVTKYLVSVRVREVEGSTPLQVHLTLDNYLAALEVLAGAVAEVREELKYPERFNLDGSRRINTTYPSSTLGPIHRWKQ